MTDPLPPSGGTINKGKRPIQSTAYDSVASESNHSSSSTQAATSSSDDDLAKATIALWEAREAALGRSIFVDDSFNSGYAPGDDTLLNIQNFLDDPTWATTTDGTLPETSALFNEFVGSASAGYSNGPSIYLTQATVESASASGSAAASSTSASAAGSIPTTSASTSNPRMSLSHGLNRRRSSTRPVTPSPLSLYSHTISDSDDNEVPRLIVTTATPGTTPDVSFTGSAPNACTLDVSFTGSAPSACLHPSSASTPHFPFLYDDEAMEVDDDIQTTPAHSLLNGDDSLELPSVIQTICTDEDSFELPAGSMDFTMNEDISLAELSDNTLDSIVLERHENANSTANVTAHETTDGNSLISELDRSFNPSESLAAIIRDSESRDSAPTPPNGRINASSENLPSLPNTPTPSGNSICSELAPQTPTQFKDSAVLFNLGVAGSPDTPPAVPLRHRAAHVAELAKALKRPTPVEPINWATSHPKNLSSKAETPSPVSSPCHRQKRSLSPPDLPTPKRPRNPSGRLPRAMSTYDLQERDPVMGEYGTVEIAAPSLGEAGSSRWMGALSHSPETERFEQRHFRSPSPESPRGVSTSRPLARFPSQNISIPNDTLEFNPPMMSTPKRSVRKARSTAPYPSSRPASRSPRVPVSPVGTEGDRARVDRELDFDEDEEPENDHDLNGDDYKEKEQAKEDDEGKTPNNTHWRLNSFGGELYIDVGTTLSPISEASEPTETPNASRLVAFETPDVSRLAEFETPTPAPSTQGTLEATMVVPAPDIASVPATDAASTEALLDSGHNVEVSAARVEVSTGVGEPMDDGATPPSETSSTSGATESAEEPATPPHLLPTPPPSLPEPEVTARVRGKRATSPLAEEEEVNPAPKRPRRGTRQPPTATIPVTRPIRSRQPSARLRAAKEASQYQTDSVGASSSIEETVPQMTEAAVTPNPGGPSARPQAPNVTTRRTRSKAAPTQEGIPAVVQADMDRGNHVPVKNARPVRDTRSQPAAAQPAPSSPRMTRRRATTSATSKEKDVKVATVAKKVAVATATLKTPAKSEAHTESIAPNVRGKRKAKSPTQNDIPEKPRQVKVKKPTAAEVTSAKAPAKSKKQSEDVVDKPPTQKAKAKTKTTSTKIEKPKPPSKKVARSATKSVEDANKSVHDGPTPKAKPKPKAAPKKTAAALPTTIRVTRSRTRSTQS